MLTEHFAYMECGQRTGAPQHLQPLFCVGRERAHEYTQLILCQSQVAFVEQKKSLSL